MEALGDDSGRQKVSRAASFDSSGLSLAQRLDRACVMGLVVATAAAHDVAVAAVLGADRTARVTEARRAVAKELRALGMSLPKIGYLLGRHHTTILHLVSEERARRQSDRSRAAYMARKLEGAAS